MNLSQRNKRVLAAPRERGVALVMALMIVALVAIVAVEVSWRFDLSMARSGNRWHGIQAKAYLEGAEQLAMVALQEDLKDEKTSASDHLNEPWAAEAAQYPTDHGYVSGKIEDAHGRFNLNLMKPEPGTCPNGQPPEQESGQCPLAQTPCDKYTPAQQMFVRLLQTLNLGDEETPVYLDVDLAEGITEAVIDWLDEDSNIRGFGGAESDHYEGLDPPIAIANQAMVSVSELMVIRGMTPELYQALVANKQYGGLVIALPVDERTRMNLNTLKGPVLRAIKGPSNCDLSPVDEEQGQAIEEFVRAGEFKDWQEVTDDPGVPSEWMQAGGQQLDISQTLFGFGPSTYFLLHAETGIGEDHVRRSQSLIRRDGGPQAAPGGNTPGTGDDNDNGQGGQPPPNPPPQQNPRGGAQIKTEVVRRTDANF